MNLTFVTGCSPDSWLRMWRTRHPDVRMHATAVDEAGQWDALCSGEADVAIVRLDSDAALERARAEHFAVQLYLERTVVVLPIDHPYADAESLTVADLDDLDRTPTQDTVANTIALSAAGVGVSVVPMSIARVHHRRDLAAVPLSDGPEWPVALVWNTDTALVQDFVGITRGRGSGSSRG